MCGQEKPLDDFYIKDKQTGRRFSWCKNCHLWRTNQRYHERTAPAREAKQNAPKPTEKRCSRCGETKPLDAFHHQRGKLCRSWCKACRAIEKAEYRAKNRDRTNAQNVEYYANDRSFILARHHQWRLEHPDRWREMMCESRQRNAEQRRAYNKRYVRANLARLNVKWHARRARKLANGGSHTVQEWEQCKAYFDYQCLMCGQREPAIKLTKDHVIPIAIGGTDAIENIQPLCQKCNSSKGNTTIDLRVDWE